MVEATAASNVGSPHYTYFNTAAFENEAYLASHYSDELNFFVKFLSSNNQTEISFQIVVQESCQLYKTY